MAYCTDVRHANEQIINGYANKVKMYAGMYEYSMYNVEYYAPTG